MGAVVTGSHDDHPERVPRVDLGPRLLPLRLSIVAANLRRLQRDVAIGCYDDDLPPRPFDPAQANSA